MAIRNIKPNTNGQRQKSYLENTELKAAKGNKENSSSPLKSLVVTKSTKTNGHNNAGRITTRHRGGGEKRKYRLIDFKRIKDGITAVVASIEYDPNRSANIS